MCVLSTINGRECPSGRSWSSESDNFGISVVLNNRSELHGVEHYTLIATSRTSSELVFDKGVRTYCCVDDSRLTLVGRILDIFRRLHSNNRLRKLLRISKCCKTLGSLWKSKLFD